MPPICDLSASELARRIRERSLSPVEVVEAHIERNLALNTALNALVTPTFAQAREQAHAATIAIERGEVWGPLHGVPFTVKDSYDVAGVRSTGGLISRSNHFPQHDATLVARLRNAGAILLGKTNLPDNNGGYETNNLIFGRTNNAWDVTRSAGGSTGGEAALIAAGGSPLGIGSDIAGSIRLPAHFNGIVGLRPTSAALPDDGFWHAITGSMRDLNALGPMARRVEDVALAWAVLNQRKPQPITTSVLHGQRLAYWFTDGITPSSEAVRGGVQAAVRALAQAGMQPIAHAPAARRWASIGFGVHFQQSGDDYACGFGNGSRWTARSELARWLNGRGRVGAESLSLWLLLETLNPLVAPLIDSGQWHEQLRHQFAEIVGPDGIAVCPVFPTTAPKHGWSFTAAPLTSSYTTWVNLAGLPALTVPVGFSGKGMPVGVQIVGNPHSEDLLLAAGMVLQAALRPVWRTPPLVQALIACRP